MSKDDSKRIQDLWLSLPLSKKVKIIEDAVWNMEEDYEFLRSFYQNNNFTHPIKFV